VVGLLLTTPFCARFLIRSPFNIIAAWFISYKEFKLPEVVEEVDEDG
jgi:hypothetical protein